MFGKQNVSGIAAIHYALADIETRSREIGAPVHVDHAANRPAVYSHAKLQPWMLFESATDFDRALCWRFGTGVKDQCHPIASWNFN